MDGVDNTCDCACACCPERNHGDGRAIPFVCRTAGGAPGGPALVRGGTCAPACDQDRAQRVEFHGADPAGGADREERHHPPGLHASPDAHGG